jgi:hypothetical protein
MKKLFFIFLFFISACSVHTLQSYDKTMYSELAQVSLTGNNGKDPYLIRKNFQNEFYLNGDDLYKNKKYGLYLNISNSVADWLIQSDSTVLRKSLIVIANFSLKDLKTNKILTSGSARSLIVFSESPSAWSSYVSEEKAYEDAVSDAMQSVRIQVSLFLAKEKNHKGKDENKSKKHR